MDIIKRYVLREFLSAFVFSLVVFTLVFTVGNIMQVADLIINKGVNLFQVIKVFFLLMPSLLTFTIPMAVLLGTLMAFGRLAGDSEIQAMLYSGISLYRIAVPVIVFVLVLSCVCVLINDRVATEFGFEARKVLKQVGVENPRALVEPGVFTRFGNYIIFAYGVKGNELKNVRVYLPKEGEPTRTVVAQSVELNFDKEKNVLNLKMRDGTSQEQSPTDPDLFYNLNFKNYLMSINIDDIVKATQIQKKMREKTIMELLKDIRSIKMEHIEFRLFEIEIHKKIALAAACLVFALISMPLAIRIHKREKSTSFGVGLALFGVYWGIFIAGIVMAENGRVPPWFGVWLGNIVIGFIGLFLFWRVARR